MATMNSLRRFWRCVESRPDGCEVWTANTTYGYGVFWCDGGTRRAHRWIWEQMVGPIPDGLELDHLCGNRACVNVEHLEPVTPQVNAERRSQRIRDGREGGCRHGHPAAEMVVRVYPYGISRQCLACNRERVLATRRAAGVGVKLRPLAERATCLHGHPMPESLTRDGKYCRVCHRDRERRRRQHVASGASTEMV